MNMWSPTVRAKGLYQETKLNILAAIIKQAVLHFPRQIYICPIVLHFNFYITSHFSEITSTILRVPRSCKVTLLSSVLLAAKIIYILIHGKMCPSLGDLVCPCKQVPT